MALFAPEINHMYEYSNRGRQEGATTITQ
eukprot:COSAG02_NODE_34254_length_487_cov_0.600515_1_plen_28_part_10